MLLRNLFEDIGPVADAAFAFGRFNPAHQGHIEVYKTVQAAGKRWFIGTNPNTQGPNDPLSFEQKSAWMQAIYPAIQGHILPQQSVVTLASKLYELLPEGSTIAYVTDSKDWEWAGKLLNDYNGKEGPHGYYKFKAIKHVESPRVSSATALRTAARANDEAAFYAASGTDPKLTVGGKTYFETVVDAVGAHPEKVKKVAKKKEPAVAEKFDSNISTSNSKMNPELRGVNIPSNMKHPEWKGPTWSFPEIAQKLGITTNQLNALAKNIGGFPKKSEGIKSTYGSKAYYPQMEIKKWVRDNKVLDIVKSKKNESFDLETSLQELSSELLGKYKKAAGADASKADKAGDFKRGDKRFSGIVKATNKQFANDTKKTK